ncbi:hypothetical protein HG536_0A05210 [Torulaspora globosa]|uniref:Importin N-terminal domain-containing protein n=1 Tax=Torulaspora globosa TaxID=48254 RepID=A0A7G3ZB20_9SACH|nr:uncharacterized protein HG536_0A05210 [Torulaspora globosa]QLL30706.1 hypothetical protein HG536_0A05210 [Torulaspora globosa]
MSLQVADVQKALQCVSSNAEQAKKNEALQFLEEFQKSVGAWKICHDILTNVDRSFLELHIFAAQTLRNKVSYDLSQLEGNLLQFKDTLMHLVVLHSQKLVVTQLSVALARLAIQYIQWKDPVVEIINCLNPYPSKLLCFLRILPEETLDIGSTPLTEDEFNSRTHELISTIAEDVLKFLISCVEILKSQRRDDADISLEQVMRCLASWCFEFPVDQLLSVEPLISIIFESLLRGPADSPEVFDAAVDCLTVVLRESRDAPNEQLVLALYEQLMKLQANLLPNLLEATNGEEQEYETMEGLTRLFVEAGEAWSVFISKSPQIYKPIVTALLMLTCKNDDLDVASYTFPFWFSLKQNLVLPRYQRSKEQYVPIFESLIGGIIKHLQYPQNQFTSGEDEDKFKEFRYHMGSVLKDCAAVVGTSRALHQPLTRIMTAVSNNGSWQELEAPLFSLRTMAQEISLSENKQLPQIFQILCNLPEHPKIRYASTLVLGRYTEWTSKHPEMLKMQLDYLFDGFRQVQEQNSAEIVTASSHALMYFCTDCSSLLSEYIDQLFDFYFQVENILDIESQFELCQGLSAVINKQTAGRISSVLQKSLDHSSAEINDLIPKWKAEPAVFSAQIADKIDLVYAIFEELKPRNEYPQQGQEPLVTQIEFIWHMLRSLLVDFGAMSDTVIVERATKLLRRLFEKFHLFCEPILESVAAFLAQGYATTGIGSYLWCSGSIIVVYGDDEALPVPPQLRDAVWQFAVSQSDTFMVNFNKIEDARLNDEYESIMDFFSMISDLIMFYPKEFILTSVLLEGTTDIALKCITKLDNYDAYILVLRCLDDIISWGFKTPPISTAAITLVPDEWREQISKAIIISRGSLLINALFIGLVTNFESSTHSDAVSCIVKCFRLAFEANNNDPTVCAQWVLQAVEQLNSVTLKEKEKLAAAVTNGLSQRDYRKVREGIKTFVAWYLRKNVSPRCY